jgi:hypothetical protein
MFSPAAPDTQTAPILKAHVAALNSQIPDVLADAKPKDDPTSLFQSFLTSGNSMFKEAAGTALNKLQSFTNTAQSYAQNFPDSVLPGGMTTYTKPAPILQQQVNPQNIAKVNFSENYMPTIQMQGGQLMPLDKVNLDATTTPLSTLSYTQPIGKTPEGTVKTETVPVTDTNKLNTASTIMAVANSINPAYTNYLLKTANNEGALVPDQRNYNFNDGTASTNPADASQHGGIASIDRGVFQINNKAFPQIPDSVADNPKLATLWAIGLIDSGNQSKWASNAKSKDMTVNYGQASS